MPGSRSRLVTIFAWLAVLPAATSCAEADRTPASSIEASELAARISSDAAPIVLDVRTPDEFAAGHIPGAINVPHTELAERLPELALPVDVEIVVHCARGGRAEAAEAILRQAGYAQVRDLDGHMKAWRSAGLPLE
jgi:rhodanese-related sulfurtransferase